MRKGVNGGESLKHSDGVIRGQHGHSRAQHDARRSCRNTGKNRLRSGDGEVIAVVLAQDKGINTHLIGANSFRDHIANHIGEGKWNSTGTIGHIAKGAKAELDVTHGFPS